MIDINKIVLIMESHVTTSQFIMPTGDQMNNTTEKICRITFYVTCHFLSCLISVSKIYKHGPTYL